MPDARAGTISATLLKGTSIAVLFDVSMPDTNYVVIAQQQGTNLAVTPWASDLTVDGFTMNLPMGVSGTILYYAIHI